MQQLNTNNYEEISLRELIEVLLKGWRLIAVITAICLFFSGIFSFLILEPTYEAKTILMASFATDKLGSLQTDPEDIAGILDSISLYPNMTIQTYKEQIKNATILQQVIDEMQLEKHDIQRTDLRKMIELETIKDTNLITIKVTHKDPKLAADIANTLAKNFTVFITDMSKQQASKSSQFLSGQLEVEKKKLDDARLELKEFLSQPRGVDELKQEFDSKLLMLTEFKTQLVQKEVELSKAKAGLAASEEELRNTPQLIVTEKSVSEDPLLSQIVTETNGTSVKDTVQITMRNEEINEGYTYIKSKEADYKISVSELSNEIAAIKTKIDSTQKEIEGIQTELADKEHNRALIQRKVDISQGTYDEFLNKYEETRIAESTEVGESTISIVSQAFVPEEPIGPRKMLNIAVAGVLGVVLSVFAVFFKEYWRTSSKAA